jgi:hypothetical protein
MKRHLNNIELLAVRHGLAASIGLIGFFMLMKLAGFVHIVELRFLNVFILGAAITTGLQSYIKNTDDNFMYLRSLGLGVLTSVIAVVPFAAFLVFYLNYDTAFMTQVMQNEWFGRFLNPYIIAFVVFLEGTISGFLATYMIMQYNKIADHRPETVAKQVQ